MKKLIGIIVILFLSINAHVFEIGENSFDGDYRKKIIEFDNLIKADSSKADPLMLDYARYRIEAIKEKLFFSK